MTSRRVRPEAVGRVSIAPTDEMTSDAPGVEEALPEPRPRIGLLAKAFVAMQGEMRGASVDSTNPHFRSKYADLSAVWDACRPVLAKYKLGVIQAPVDVEGGRVGMKTIILHESGEMLELPIYSTQITKHDPQGVGSAVTYMRRYSLKSALGISDGEEDDDGNAASSQSNTPPPRAGMPPDRASSIICPNCQKPAIIKSKFGGWVCFDKKGGCGAKFADNDPSMGAAPEKSKEESPFDDLDSDLDDVSVKVDAIIRESPTKSALKARVAEVKKLLEGALPDVQVWAREEYTKAMKGLPE